MALESHPQPIGDEGARVPPRTPREQTIASIWATALERTDIGVYDDFFELDGDSLAAIDVIAKIRDVYGVSIQSMSFFEAPTVAALAAAVAAAAPSERPPVTPRDPDSEPVLSFDQQRLWLENQLAPESAYNVHGRLRLSGPLDVAALNASIAAILQRHQALRSRFPLVDGRPQQAVDEVGADWHIAVRDVGGEPGDQAAAARRAADEDAATPFDLATGPLFRCTLIRLSDTEHVLSITAHHIVCDDWSTGLFVRELSALYLVGGDATRAELPPLPVQYRDFAAWQRRWLVGEALEGQVNYWRDHLAGAPPALNLPTTRWRVQAEEARGDRIRAVLSEADTEAVHRLCRQYHVTTFMALLASLGTVLARWTGDRDVVIGVPITGRTDAGTKNLIGFFVNTLPLRIDLAGRPSFADLLDRVRRAALGGYEHADAPLDLLAGQLKFARVPGRTPLFQVALNGVDDFGVEPLSGVTTQPMDAPAPPSKFDLTLTARESGGVLHLDLEYNADRYTEPMIRALFEQVRTLLLAAVADSDRAVFDYPLSDAEPAVAPVPAALPDLRSERIAVLSPRPGHGAAANASGGEVAPTTDAPLGDLDALLVWLRDAGISVLHVDPPVLRALAARAGEAGLPSLRHVFVGNRGDFLAHDVELVRQLSASADCVGLYGVDEPDGPLAAYPVPDGWKLETAPLRVPLGTELPGSSLRLPDRSGRPAAVGEVVELHAGERRTGHLGRRWADGTLEFVGTTDPTPDVTETVGTLRDAPDVREALVTGLVAYVCGPQNGAGAVHQHLVTRLPENLLPRHLMVLDRLPLTADGEYDLAALPQPDEDSEALGTYVPPRTPLERELTAILHELLDVERIGVYDSFFELGGFSLLATRLVARVRDVYGVELPLRDLFGSATVDQLARLVVQAQAELAGVEDLEALLDERIP